jgi:hypothetical protein
MVTPEDRWPDDDEPEDRGPDPDDWRSEPDDWPTAGPVPRWMR